MDHLRVCTGQCQRLAVRGKGNLVDPTAVAGQLRQLLAGVDVPAVGAAVHGAAGECLAVRRKLELHAALLVLEAADDVAGLHIPEMNRLKGIAGGDEFAVGREGHGDDCPLVAPEPANLLAGDNVANVNGLVLVFPVHPGDGFAVG